MPLNLIGEKYTISLTWNLWSWIPSESLLLVGSQTVWFTSLSQCMYNYSNFFFSNFQHYPFLPSADYLISYVPEKVESTEKYPNIPITLTHTAIYQNLYLHTPHPFLLKWMAGPYSYTKLISPFLWTRFYSFLSTQGHWSSKSSFSLLIHQIFALCWIVPIAK